MSIVPVSVAERTRPMLVISERQRDAECQRANELAAHERWSRREKLAVLLIIVACNVVGLILMGLGMSAVDQVRGELYFIAGLALGYGGMFLTLIGYFVRLGERGEIGSRGGEAPIQAIIGPATPVSPSRPPFPVPCSPFPVPRSLSPSGCSRLLLTAYR